MGTLDPLASGVLPLGVGAAARLDRFMEGQGKTYEAGIRFGFSTSTDDAAGEVLRRGKPQASLYDKAAAQAYLNSILGAQKQLPPVYSAIKVNGERSYAAARKGRIIDLEPRDIVVHEAQLLGIDEAEDGFEPIWHVRFRVSKGTYLRSLARDAGIALGCPAHISSLRRTACGAISLDDCVSLEALESRELSELPLLDPVKILGYRFVFCEGRAAAALENGAFIGTDNLDLFTYAHVQASPSCACTSGVMSSNAALHEAERICMIRENELKAVYRYDSARASLRPECVFQQGVRRG